MRLNQWSLPFLGLFLAISACGDGLTELVVRGAGPDGCEYSGPSDISSGSIELLASPSGSGRILAVIYELDTPPSGGEVDDGGLGRVVATVEAENEVNLVRRSEELEPGHYAIGCVYGEFDGLVGTLVVSP